MIKKKITTTTANIRYTDGTILEFCEAKKMSFAQVVKRAEEMVGADVSIESVMNYTVETSVFCCTLDEFMRVAHKEVANESEVSENA